ncbi:GNAT family protein [Oxalobacteraceae bacterium R-40]|uniref:GNAT family protein n=1 Tax=Keguizhuia sedimenti TaxID=3064264 RepID=A0ABU1BLU2_9BURK|nr:GNAT family protein [Oxalobacteraceae bacterium R-40]
MAFVEPIMLTGRYAALEPLDIKHAAGLEEAVMDGELWKLWFTAIPAPEEVAEFVEQLLSERAQGKSMAFAVRDNKSGKIVGSTRYLNIDAGNRRLEIGGTWYAARAQRTAINTECKLLLLTHAFEALDCIAVEFRTDWLNQRSQAAIERLGAKRDGVLRNHRIMPDGRIRDTVCYSILRNEWNGVKINLQHKLERD